MTTAAHCSRRDQHAGHPWKNLADGPLYRCDGSAIDADPFAGRITQDTRTPESVLAADPIHRHNQGGTREYVGHVPIEDTKMVADSGPLGRFTMPSVSVEFTGPISPEVHSLLTGRTIVEDFAAAQAADPKERLKSELREWWVSLAYDEADQVVDKAVEYGALDLVVIGRDLAANMGREVTDAEATELGIYFYVIGKMARWTSAIREGRAVSDDTLMDIGVYIRMAQRTRDVGGWPNGE